MAHAVTVAPPPFTLPGLVVHTVPAATDNLVWIAVCERTGAAAVVDGPSAEEALAYAQEHGLLIEQVWVTHTHGDHVGIVRDLAARGGLRGRRVFGPPAVRDAVRLDPPLEVLTDPVGEGSAFRLGEVEVRVLETPGHLDGHVSFLAGQALFCGDTLFTGGCGFLFDGPPDAMFRSLMRLAACAPETRVCCAHEYTLDNLRFAWLVEPDNEALAARIRDVRSRRARGECTVPSTIALERATNPFLRPGSPTLIRRVAERLPERDLSTPLAVFAATRALKDRKDHRAIGDHELPS